MTSYEGSFAEVGLWFVNMFVTKKFESVQILQAKPDMTSKVIKLSYATSIFEASNAEVGHLIASTGFPQKTLTP